MKLVDKGAIINALKHVTILQPKYSNLGKTMLKFKDFITEIKKPSEQDEISSVRRAISDLK